MWEMGMYFDNSIPGSTFQEKDATHSIRLYTSYFKLQMLKIAKSTKLFLWIPSIPCILYASNNSTKRFSIKLNFVMLF